MLHIFLLILKIIGILLLVIIALALLILFYPIAYKIQGSKSDKDYQLSIKAHWLLRFVSYKGVISNDGKVSKLRIFFVPIDFLKKKQKKDKKDKPEKTDLKKQGSQKKDSLKDTSDKKVLESCETTELKQQKTQDNNKNDSENTNSEKTFEQKISEDIGKTEETNRLIEKKQESDNKERKKTHININYTFNFLKEKIKDIKGFILSARKNIKNIYSKFKEKCAKVRAIKAFINSPTTKKAFKFGKEIIIKTLRHIFPKKIKGNIEIGFESPDLTGKTLGYIAMGYSVFNVNPKKIKITPDFQNEIFNGNVKLSGHIMLGVVLYYGLRFYFNKEIHRIIKKIG